MNQQPPRGKLWARLAAPAMLLALATGVGLAGGAERQGPAAAGTRLDALRLAHRIDQLVNDRLRAEGVTPSPRADDAEFLRRLYLDLTGHIPPADRVAAFLDSPDPSKRGKLIDELLASSDFGKHQADIWQAMLLPRSSDNRRLQQFYPRFTAWLEEGFNANKSWDRLVSDLLTATGEPEKNPGVIYYMANPTPDKLTDNVTRLFLGVQLQCAQCHNHPFTEWKQTEYWGMASFFMKVRFQGNPRQIAKKGGTVVLSENGRGRQPRLPVSAKRVPPRFFRGVEAKVDASSPYRPVLAQWMTSPDNPFFARAMVNRTWYQLFGRGIVMPVDDMHDANPPSHPEVLAELTTQLTANGFDLKYLVRAICNSAAYQRTSRPTGDNADAAPQVFARMAVKALTPEQTFDSLTEVLGSPAQGRRRPAKGAKRFGPVTARGAFVAFFNVEDGADPTEYQGGIPQALRLMNAPALNNGTRAQALVRPGRPPAEAIEQLYLATLARRPRPAERDHLLAYVGRQDNPRTAYTDVLWALLNSSEFSLNH